MARPSFLSQHQRTHLSFPLPLSCAWHWDVSGVDAGGRLSDGNGGSVGSGGNSGGSGDGRGGNGGASVAKTKTRVASSEEQGVSLSGDQGGRANLHKLELMIFSKRRS